MHLEKRGKFYNPAVSLKRSLNRELARVKDNEPFPPNAFVESTLPLTSEDGIPVYVHALTVKRRFSEHHWQLKEEALGIKDRNDYQIIIIPSPHRIPKRFNTTQVDVTQNILKILTENPMGKYPVGVYIETPFADDIEGRKIIENEAHAETVYLVASPLSEKDLLIIQTIASRLKKSGVKKVVLTASFIGFGREDKDGKVNEQKQVINTAQMLTLKAALKGWQGLIDFIYTAEPHSSATQGFAAEAGIDLAPISLWKYMIDMIDKEEEFDRANLIGVAPDLGRNFAVTRMCGYLGIPLVSFNKYRDPDSRDLYFDPLTSEQLKIVMGEGEQGGKDFILYDDEGASLSTSKDIITELILNHKPRSIRLVLAHRRFTASYVYDKIFHDGWQKNLHTILELANQHGVQIKVYLSDTRESIGNIEEYERDYSEFVRLIKIAPFLLEQIKNDVKGINPFVKPSDHNEDLILQAD